MNYKFSHIGIHTDEEKKWDGFFEPKKIHFTDFNNDDFAIEWVKFDDDSPMPDVMRRLPHLAFEVDNLDEALKGKEILVEPFSPGEGARVAFIMHDRVPVEFMEVK